MVDLDECDDSCCHESQWVDLGGSRLLTPTSWVSGTRVFVTSRIGGVSTGAYADFNLAAHVGDDPECVLANRHHLQTLIATRQPIGWLRQVHGTDAVPAHTLAPEAHIEADASWTDRLGVACAALTADCLAIALAAEDGSVVGAIHAGWRGLLNDIIGNTLNALPVSPANLRAWLGPAIGPAAFEVGPEVRASFLTQWGAVATDGFYPGRNDRYHADLCRLARIRLRELGVGHVTGGGYCTYARPESFYSYRREGITGRMAMVIVRDR